jgi:putative ABC transport system permease protein
MPINGSPADCEFRFNLAPPGSEIINRKIMITNYFRLALRNLAKRKGYSFLNIFGLALGITCCLLIFQYVAFERSFDRFEKKADRIVRLRLDNYHAGELQWKSATSYPAFGPTMKKDFPEIEDFCRLHDADLVLSNDEKNIKFKEDKGYYADPSFLNMFDIHFLSGNKSTALDGPDKIVISENTAKKYFGSSDAVGKKLVFHNPPYTCTFLVTGVFAEFPANSHLIINHLASYATLAKLDIQYGDTSNATETSFGWYDFYTYLLLRPGSDINKLEAKLPAYCDHYMNNREWSKTNKVKTEVHLIPLSDIYLYSNYNQEAETNGSGRSVSFLFIIAFFIIGIAWINYINLSTARSLERAKEVGIRKVLGALRKNLIGQFLIESLLLNIIAFLLSVGIVYLLAPWFNQLTGANIGRRFYLPGNYWLGFAGMFLAGSFCSGIYPAFVLSGFQPIQVLKGLFKSSIGGITLRKSLIVGQFAASVILITGTIIVFQQVNFMRSQRLGVNINQTLVLEGGDSQIDSVYEGTLSAFKQELLKNPEIKSITASTSVMGREIYWTNDAKRLGIANKGEVTLYNMAIDYDFIPSFGLEIKAGRNFSRDFKTDKKAVLLNEQAARLLGFDDYNKALREMINSAGDTVKVLGIVANYHHQGLQKVIDPMIFRLRMDNRDAYSIKISTGNLNKTLSAIEKTWNAFFPSDPFNYFFLDELFDSQYKSDKQFGKMFALFSALAICIACFGLLGLSAYNVLQRNKEIGVRKILGASVQNILYLLSRDFLKLVLVAFLIASPLTWWLMHNWLEDFAFRINIPWWSFLLAGVLSLLIALCTICIQALKAAVSNPVNSLRNE